MSIKYYDGPLSSLANERLITPPGLPNIKYAIRIYSSMTFNTDFHPQSQATY
jgi:hypothetical protein